MAEVVKSCDDCIFKLEGAAAAARMKKSLGVAVCGKYGKPLSRIGATDESNKARDKYFAKECPSFNKGSMAVDAKARAWENDAILNSASKVGERNLTVALPIPKLRTETDGTQKSLCTSCATCAKFVRDDAVLTDLGWSAGMCGARGQLVLPSMLGPMARNCEYREYGTPSTLTHDIILLPEFEKDFGRMTVEEEIEEMLGHSVDPLEYETDRPVSDADILAGIKAWRKIVDPSNKKRHTHLPIYNPEIFSEEDRALIPRPGDDEHPELYLDHFGGVYTVAVCWTELDETPLVNGQAGTGKTELFRYLAYLMQTPFVRISITASTELDDIAGKMHFSTEEGTHFKYGRLPASWMKPGVICIDEPNTGPPEVWQFLRPLTDNSKQLILDVNEGEVIKRHDDCYMGMAVNPAWDPKNVGAMEIGDADANRLFHIYLDMPPEELERDIINARVALDGWVLEPEQLRMVMAIAHDVRNMIAAGGLSISWAIRPQIKVARALKWFDTVTAYRRAVADYLEPDAQETLLSIVRSHS